MRLGDTQASAADQGGLGGDRGSSQRLFVFRGIERAQFSGSQYQVPPDAFAHTDPAAIVHLEAVQVDGKPLPDWLKFDSLTGIFSGEPPGSSGRMVLQIRLNARDDQGREATSSFDLEFDPAREPGLKPQSAGLPSAEASEDAAEQRAQSSALEEAGRTDLEAAEREQAERDAKAEKIARGGVRPFAEQLRNAKANRDPVLARIFDRPSEPSKADKGADNGADDGADNGVVKGKPRG